MYQARHREPPPFGWPEQRCHFVASRAAEREPRGVEVRSRDVVRDSCECAAEAYGVCPDGDASIVRVVRTYLCRSKAAGELSVQLYRRVPRKKALPASLAKLLGSYVTSARG